MADGTAAAAVVPPNTAGLFEDSGTDNANEHSSHEDEQVDGDWSDEDGSPPPPPHELDSYPWIAISEDKTAPCDDEIKYIESKEEHSALDHAYWQQKTFFDLLDPQLQPGESGRIDWLVEHFNGTKEQPNRQLIMTSQTVSIAGHDWRIKLYPKGNRTDFISVYIECLTMQNEDFKSEQDFTRTPLPRPAGTPPLKQRIYVAAQVSVIMYNPAEPRVHEYKIDAHQFHQASSDFGWRYFTQEPRHGFHIRRHGQRQSILKDDQLAFTAYIRVVQDPTGSLWKSAPAGPDPDLSTTSLRPFDNASPSIAAFVMLLHLRFFRRWLQDTKSLTPESHSLRQLLTKAMQRRLKRKHLKRYGFPDGCDVIEILNKLRYKFKDSDPSMHHLLTVMTDVRQRIGHDRLKTRMSTSVQQAINELPFKPRKEPPILLLEFDRCGFSESKREWQQAKNPVKLDERIEYGSRAYILYGFVTHKGALGSGHYTPFVRPGGPTSLWYMYDVNDVRCLTQKSAHLRAIGLDMSTQRSTQPTHQMPTNELGKSRDNGVAYLAWYIRDDYGSTAWSTALEEPLPTLDVSSSAPQLSKPQGLQPPTKDGTTNEKAMLKTQVSALRSTINGSTSNIMDGEDVVMSDNEGDEPREASINHNICAAGAPVSTPPAPVYKTTRRYLAYHSGEWYGGDVLPDNVYHGSGRLIRSNGDVYSGEFQHGEIHGQGKMVYCKSGDVYEGQWQHGQHHGIGKLTEQKTGNVYEGGWKEGRRHGDFVLRGTVTEDDKHYCQICYENIINTAFVPCGHALTCDVCAHKVTSCPVCRKPIHARQVLFGVKISMQ